MVVPTGVLWERDLHTAAKHTLLRRYLSAWFPIMARTFRAEGIIFLDGFAGPGEYLNSEESSPVIALDQALRDEVVRCGTDTRLAFIEDNSGRADNLRVLLDTRFPPSHRPSNYVAEVFHGKCGDLYAAAVEKVGGWRGPVFANLDGWGTDTNYDIVQRLAKQQSSEVLVTFQDQFFIRFAGGEQESGERVFGHSDWRQVDQLPTSAKRPFLLNLYRQGLRDAGFPFVLTFEMIDEGGHSLHLFFGTSSEVAVEKFKDGLWEVDGIAGQRFCDPRDRNQLTFDILQPDFSPLANTVLDLLGSRDHTMEELCKYALLETHLQAHPCEASRRPSQR